MAPKRHGHIVVDGQQFPLVSMRLSHGEIQFVAHVPGPHAAGSGRMITVFGEDARGVCQLEDSLAWPEIPAGSHCLLTFGIRLWSQRKSR